MLQRTPLYEAHVALGARMVDFGGWEMPVQYAGIIEETKATRTAVGLFDIGHMGRIEVVGPDHVAAVDWVVTCDVQKLGVGRCKYGILSTERGTAIDDVLVYRDTDRTHLVITDQLAAIEGSEMIEGARAGMGAALDNLVREINGEAASHAEGVRRSAAKNREG